MDKYEFNIKVDQIKKRVEEGDYGTAMKIADAIDWSRVRNINLLTLASSVYEENGEYDEARDKLLMAFERAPVGKRLLYKLCELSVKAGDLEEAKDYYNEFVDVAPDDAGAHILAYMILRKGGASLDQQITELSEYTTTDPDERWLYELAKVYDEAGYGRECAAVCDRIALLFGAGRYSEKAMKLKAKYTDLTAAQKQILGDERKKPEAPEAPAPEEISDELAAIRYENEDEAFEQYLKVCGLDKPLEPQEEPQAPSADMTAELSREVEKLTAEPEAEIHDTEEERTIILDESRVKELRSFILKGGKAAATAASAARMDAETARKNAMKQAAGIVAGRPAVSISVESVKPVPAPGLPKEVIAPVVEADRKAEAAAAERTPVKIDKVAAEAPAEAPAAKEAESQTAAEAAAETATAPKAAPAAVEAPQAEPAAEPAPATEPTPAAEPAPAAEPEVETLPTEPVRKHHMIIEAEDAESGFDIARDELKAIHKEFNIQNAALKTTAEKLNQRGLTDAVLERIKGKDFIVEHAGDLSPAVLDSIYRILRTDESGTIVVLIDVPEGLDRIEARKPEIFGLCDLVSDFDEEYEDEGDLDEDDADDYDDSDEPYDESYDDEDDEDDYEEPSEEDPEEESEKPAKRGSKKQNVELHSNLKVNAPRDKNEEMEIDDFAQYCCQYASEIDCSITGKSMLALYERIELMEEDSIPLTRANAVRLIEEAADRAEKPPIGKRLKGMFSSKYDKNGLLILKEEDFIY